MRFDNTVRKALLLLSTAAPAIAIAAPSMPARIANTQSESQSDAGTAKSAATASRLSGIITDSSGAAIAGARIVVKTANGDTRREQTTDRIGGFAFSGLPTGNYTLIVSSSGFRPRNVHVSIGNSPYILNISLALSDVSTTVTVQGREDDLIGLAGSASQGTVGAEEIGARPILRSGEILETIPGVIITQHAGGGKANQYFLRGFNLDHGTDFAIFIDDMPLNLPSHAHGEGYADMNTVIPELVKRVNYDKGPYYADVGNYGSAGSAHLEFFRTLSHNFIQLEGGMDGYARLVFATSQKWLRGNLMYGGEAYHDDGPWVHPDNYFKFNGLLTYSQGEDSNGFSITARAYHGQWHSSDQIPVDAVPLVGFFGTLNPTDGGHSQRYSLQSEWHRETASSATKITAYGFYYDLNLFSDFTYYLTDLTRGDQFEQKDRRWVAGLGAHHTVFSQWLGRRMEDTVGLQIRNDWIRNGLYQSEDRLRVEKTDSATGNTLPAITQADRFTDTQVGFYAENRTQWTSKFRSIAALRGDAEYFEVTSLVNASNSGAAGKVLPSPKLSLIFGPWANTELYTQAGFSFHSNDGRGTTLRVEPVSADNPYPNTPATPIPPLIPTKGGEFGVRTAALPHLQSTLSVWYLHSASELQQSGDTGGTVASQQPSERYGFELANYYTPGTHWAIDFDLANSKALFTGIDPDDAAPGSPGGKRVPEAVGWVLASGLTMREYRGFSSSLRLRFFGPRDLTSDGIFRSRATALVNGELGYRLGERWRISAELLNLLDRRDHDIDYAYESRIHPTAPSAFTDVFHPVEPIQVRFWLSRTF